MSQTPFPGVLVADDDPQFLRLVSYHLSSWAHRVDTVTDKGQLLRKLAAERPGLLLLDVRFGEHDGVEILRQVLAECPGLKVVMLTAFGSIDNATTAIKLGAIDYLTKPVDVNRLRSVVADALETASPPAAVVRGTTPTAPRLTRSLLGESEAVNRLRDLIAKIAATDSTALILGESGTGKELVARALHDLSSRRSGPFVALNVAALPRELVESTLFGHAKGAFTGADQMQRGCCEAADHGTLFLDEIGEMEIGLQAKLLRFLQERSFQRVGQTTPVSVDVRIVAATNRNPLEQVRKGELREDLYYRLNVLPIVVPPLRERRDDIPLLARHFLARFCARSGRESLALLPAAEDELCRHDWPGNVRELENLVERLAVLSPGPTIGPDEIRSQWQNLADNNRSPPAKATPSVSPESPLTEMERIERDAIAQALAAAQGNVRTAAKSIGLGQATVYRKIKKYGIETR